MNIDIVKSDKKMWNEEQMKIIKSTICKDCTDDEIILFGYICKRTQLDPFARQIYSVKRKDRMVIQTGIDGFRLIAERTNRYSPGREYSHEYDKNGKLLKSTAYIKKMTADGSWHEVSASAYWSEYAQEYNGKPSQFWAKMPHLMLGKCAESLALRKAFPADLSGIYTEDEMGQEDRKPIDEAQNDSQSDEKSIVFNPENEGTVIKKYEIDDLLFLVKQCSQDYQKNFNELMRERSNGNPYEMTLGLFKGLKKRTQEKLENEQALRSGDFEYEEIEEVAF